MQFRKLNGYWSKEKTNPKRFNWITGETGGGNITIAVRIRCARQGEGSLG